MKLQRFVRRSRIPASAEEVFRWHAEPGALRRLTPPWEPVEVVDEGTEGGGLRDGVEVTLRVRIGPVRVLWVSKLSECRPGRSFRDTQIRGPFGAWSHLHLMEPDGSTGSPGDTACWLEDRIDYAPPFGFLGRWFGGWFVRRKLNRLFDYRHRVTAEAFQRA